MPPAVADWTSLGLIATLFATFCGAVFTAARWWFRDVRGELTATRDEVIAKDAVIHAKDTVIHDKNNEIHRLRTLLAQHGIDWPDDGP